jgi:hypothetical protein
MKMFLRIFAVASFAAALAGSASASTVWDLDATFSYNQTANTATGTITLDSSLHLVSWDITVTGTNTAADNVYTSADSFAIFPDLTHLDFYDSSTNQYINLYLASPFTNSGGDITLLAGNNGQNSNSTVVCAGCGVLVSGQLSDPPAATPEPSSVALFATGAGILGIAVMMRKREEGRAFVRSL